MARRGGRSTAARRARLVAVVLVVAVAIGLALRPSPPDDPTAATSPTTPTTVTPAAPTDPRSEASATTPVPTSEVTATSVGTARAEVDRLVVGGPPTGLGPYRRDAFLQGGDWDYDPASGCNTRERVLIEESQVPPTIDSRCRATGGRWRSTYDGLVVTDVARLQIDHLIPLADAWRSGAAAWTPARRQAFANDLTHPETLIAVSGSTNASKGDSTPDQWLPPDRSSWCAYATAWVDVKATWQLTVTPPEKATLVQVLAGC